MQIDVFSIPVFIVCCILPFCVALVIILAINTRGRWKDAGQILRNLRDESYDSRKLLPVPTRYMPVYILISVAIVGSLICISIIALGYYLGLPLFSNINSKTFVLVSLAILLLAVVITFIGLILNKINKMKE
jgi:magnesium-transporting ATPase (P-type)